MADSWVRKTVRLTEKEASILAQRAGEAGIPENRYIRILIRQKPADYPAVQQHLKALINETNRIGNNVNQIVMAITWVFILKKTGKAWRPICGG